MAYIVHDPSLYKAIRNEIYPALSKGQVGLISRLDDCQRIVAIYHEILRLNTASVSIRSVDAPTDLGSVTMSAGAKVLIPYRHYILTSLSSATTPRNLMPNASSHVLT